MAKLKIRDDLLTDQSVGAPFSGSDESIYEEEKPKKRKVKVKEDDEAANKFTEELAEFLEDNTGIKATSLKQGGNIPYWIDTGSYALNWIISNNFFHGFPGTRISLISGEEGKGKSFLMDVLLGNNVKMGGASFKVMIEAAANYDFSSLIVGSEDIAEKINVIKAKQDAKGNINPITIERLTSILYKAIDYQASKKEKKNKSLVFGIDSMTQLTSDKELAGVEKRADGKKETKDMTSAVKMRELFRTIEQQLEYSNVSIIGIGQLTANIQTGWVPRGTPKTVINVKGSGGKFASSLTINMISDKEIKDPKTDTPVGIKMRLKTTKNRIQFKGRDCYLYFYFARGVDRFGGLADLLAKYGVLEPVIMKENAKGEVKEKKAIPEPTGEFKPEVTFKWSDGTDGGLSIKFKKFNMAQVIEANGGEELLKKWNEQLNKIYDDILKGAGISEEDYLEDDGLDIEAEMEKELSDGESEENDEGEE